MYENASLRDISHKEYDDFLKKSFDDSPQIKSILKFIKYHKITEIINFLEKNGKYLEAFNNLDLQSFLNSRIRIQVNLLNAIIEDLDGDIDEYSAGTLIAEANNDTQKVRADDIFGNKYKKELEEKLFNEFNKVYGDKISIEYRLGEAPEKVEKVHILPLLRPIVATGIICKEKEIFRLTNQRYPIYKLFEKLLKKENVDNTISVISKLIPFLYEIRTFYVDQILSQHKRKLIRDYKEKALRGDLEESIFKNEIREAKGKDEEIEKIVKKIVTYNIEHIMPVLVFRIRKLIIENIERGKLELNIPEEAKERLFETLIETIYESYVKMKLKGLPTSLTTVVRDSDFYDLGSEAYKFLIKQYNLTESNYIEKNNYIIN